MSLPHSSTLGHIKVRGGEWDNAVPLIFAMRVPAALRISTEFREWCLEITAFNTRNSSPRRSWTTWCRQSWWSETHIRKYHSQKKKEKLNLYFFFFFHTVCGIAHVCKHKWCRTITHHSLILESHFGEYPLKVNVCWALSAAPRGYVVYALIWTKTMFPCGAADTEQHTLFTFSGYSPKWRQGDAEETNWE